MADIKVSMGVTGVAQFKQAMTTSRQSVKNLDAELKLNEAQYKKTGDAETYMSKKSELLKKQIAEQEKVVKAAEDALETMTKNGTDPASKAFLQMQNTLTTARTRLVEMQTGLKGVTKDGKDAAKSTDTLGKSIKDIARNTSFQSITSGISGIASTAEKAVSSVLKLGKAIWTMETGSGQYADDVFQLATNYGVSTDFVQQLKFAEGTTKISAEEYLSMMDKMAKSLDDAKYKTLGINPAGMTRQDIMFSVIDSLNKIRSQGTIGADKEVDDLAQSIFGKSFRDLGTITTNGVAWFKETLAGQDIVSDTNLEKLNAFNDAVETMNDQLLKLKLDVSAELAEPMQKLAESFTGLVTTVDNWVNSEEGQQMIGKLMDGIKGVFDDITEEDIGNAFEKITSAVEGVVSAFTWIIKNTGLVIDAFATIAGSKAVLDLMKVASGIGGLLGGKSNVASAAGSGISTASAAAGGAGIGAAVEGAIFTGISAAVNVAGAAAVAGVAYDYLTHTAGNSDLYDENGKPLFDTMIPIQNEHGAGRENINRIGDIKTVDESNPLPVTITTPTDTDSEWFSPVSIDSMDFDTWNEWMINEMTENVAKHSEEIEAMGNYVMSSFMRGVMSGMSGAPAMGGTGGITSNVYVGNMNMSGGVDAYDLAGIVQQQLAASRRGVGS